MDQSGILFALLLLVMIALFFLEPLRRLLTPYKWDVFVSHKREDNEIIKPIIERLKHSGFRVWVDWDEIPDEFRALFRGRISRAIQLSSFALVFTSANFRTSNYCMEEADFFLKRFKEKPERIIEVRLNKNDVRDTLEIPAVSKPIDFEQYRVVGNQEAQYEALVQEITSRLTKKTK